MWAALLTGFVGGWDATALFFVYPDIRDGLAGGDDAAASWVLSVTSIVSAGVLLQAGRLADRFGHQRLYRVGAALYTVGAVAAAAAPELWTLIAARAGQSAGLAVMGPASVAIILRATPERNHAEALGRWGLITAIAGVAGPVTVATLIDSVDWRVMFAIQMPLGAALWVLAHADAGVDRPDPAVRVRTSEALLAMITLVALAVPIVEGNDWGWTSPPVVVCLAVAAAGATTLYAMGRNGASAIPVDLFANRPFAVAAAMSITAGALFFGQWLAFLLFLTDVWDYGLVGAALLLTIMPGAMTLTSLPFGRLVDRRGHRAVMLPGAAVYAATAGAFWLGAGPERNLVLLLPVLVAAGVAMAALWPTLSSLAVIGVPAERLGTASAALQTIQRVGAAIGVALVVALVASGPDTDVLAQHLRGVLLLPIAAAATAVAAVFVPMRVGDGTAGDQLG